MPTALEIIQSMTTSLLFETAISRAEAQLALCAAGSKGEAYMRAELDEARARWEREATLRATREWLKARGVIRSRYGDGWVRKVRGRWVAVTPEQAAADLLGEKSPDAD